MKKILLLGAANFQMPPIVYAKNKGHLVITCDNVPSNPGHKIADKSYLVSTVDKDAILKIAAEEKINGIMTFGSDVSAPTVSYIAEKMGLSANPSAAVDVLVHKDKFRRFLNETGLQPLPFRIFSLSEQDKINDYILAQGLPQVIKPTDSAGSKGVSILDTPGKIAPAIKNAFAESRSGMVIVEQYFRKSGKQVCGDGYFEKGKLKHIFFGDGHFYEDHIHNAPWGETFPSAHNPEHLENAKQKLEKVLQAAGFRQGSFNFDVFIGENGDCFIIEIGPRSGGNYIPAAIKYKYGIDLVAANVELALDADYTLEEELNISSHFYSCYMLHAKSESGRLEKFSVKDEFASYVCETNPYVENGQYIEPFIKANLALANYILKFDTFDEMNDVYRNNIHSKFSINLAPNE